MRNQVAPAATAKRLQPLRNARPILPYFGGQRSREVEHAKLGKRIRPYVLAKRTATLGAEGNMVTPRAG